MMRTKRLEAKGSSAGFTMLEMVIAMSILAIVVAVNYKLLQNIILSKQILDDQRDGMFIANSVLTRLSREIQLMDGTHPLLPECGSAAASATPAPASAPAGGAPPNPAASGPRLLITGEEKSIGTNARGDTLTFMAREAGQYIPDGGTHSGIVQITYRVEPDPDQSGSKDATFLLIRDELPYRKPVSKACAAALHFPITKNLLALELNYYDKRTQTWTPNWTADKSTRLPRTIQFKVTLRSPQGRIETYTSAVTIKERVG